MDLETIPYSRYEKGLPQKGNWIIGQETGDSIIVYQAFNPEIAGYAVANQKFGGPAYSFSRMTWIKPNFLWMMYRSGWATKPGQERILAIKMSKAGFLDLLHDGVFSSFNAANYPDHDTWRDELARSEVRIQWDPDHGPRGEKLERRAVQIGIRGRSLEKFNAEYIREIADITPFVARQRENLVHDEENFLVVSESIVETGPALKSKYGIDDTFISPETCGACLSFQHP